MTIASRLKEERQRLGLSQGAFAALAGATKSAQVKWEREDSSAPTAPALAAFAEAGADVLYVLTGRRTFPLPDNVDAQVRDHVAVIRENLLASGSAANGSTEEAELAILSRQLSAILRHDGGRIDPGLQSEVEELQRIVADPVRLTAFRAADYAQIRARRREIRHQLDGLLNGTSYHPDDLVVDQLATLALDYSVPLRLLADLVSDIGEESAGRERGAPVETVRRGVGTAAPPRS